jgi:GDP-L-fucose synthase
VGVASDPSRRESKIRWIRDPAHGHEMKPLASENKNHEIGCGRLPLDARIFVAGHRGMVGSALVRRLQADGYRHLLMRSRSELDLTDQNAVNGFFRQAKIDAVFLAAAKVGGIHANSTYPADFVYQNLMIEANVIRAAWEAGVARLLFLGSSCIYPKHAPQPMREEYLLSGYLEATNAPYALAKIAGIMLCESYNRQHGTRFRAAMPTNLYGPEDSFDLEDSHVLPALLRKLHLAKLAQRGDWQAIASDAGVFGPIPPGLMASLRQRPPTVPVWGTGSPRREFLHVDDVASACLFIMKLTDEDYQRVCRTDAAARASLPAGAPVQMIHINVGCGQDLSIRALAENLKSAVGFDGDFTWDPAQPDGTPRKVLDVSRLKALGWEPAIDFDRGIASTYDWYLRKT